MKTQFITLWACCFLTSFLSLAQDVDPVVEEQPKTVMEFEKNEIDFGKIEQSDIVSYVLKFTNTGEHPLIITEAKGSCGCTVPFYPQVPIMPGERSEIEISFDPTGKVGVQRKTVTIAANTSPALTVINIVADVLPPEKEAEENENDIEEIQRNKAKQDIEAVEPNCFAIYPNPTNEVLQLELKEHIGLSAMVDIHSKEGQKILSKRIDRISRESTQFDVSSFTPGMYMITIRVNNYKPMTQCFVVTGK